MSDRTIDMTGKRFNSLVAIEPVGRNKCRNIVWKFSCDCGNQCEIDGYSVRTGKAISCQECGAKRVKVASIKHGMTYTKEFGIWTDMHTRCYNKNSTNFANYGGRGIVICERWRESFQNFLNDMGPRPTAKHSIDRINVNGNYTPENCRWATPMQQGCNKRNNVWITINGVTKILSAWAREFNVDAATAALRYRNGLRGINVFQSKAIQITYAGVTDTISGWSKRTGIKKSTIAMRLKKYQWPIEKALTKGAQL